MVQPPGLNPAKLPELIENTHKRLERVQIECSSYELILKRFDSPNTIFYLDPPYWGRQLYRYNFEPTDFEHMETHLREIRGKFVLSLNDVPEVRKLFSRFHFTEVELAYTSQKQAGRKFRELLITNFKW